MQKFQPKVSANVEAAQWFKAMGAVPGVGRFVHGKTSQPDGPNVESGEIVTYGAHDGDWVVKHADDTYTVMRPDAFAATYEPIVHPLDAYYQAQDDAT